MILSRYGPQDLITVRSVRLEVTFMPVAQAPREKALITNGGRSRSSAVRANPTWSSSRVARRSDGPRTQLVGVPDEPDDSSTTTPRRGRRPRVQRSVIEYLRM